jgi:hypothetical protein
MPAAVPLAIAGATLASGVMSSRAQAKAGDKAAQIQAEASAAEIGERRRQFDQIQELLKPYVGAGTGALTGQQDLLGLNGESPQQAAIAALERSPQFAAMQQQGENSILANASATGGLRGGNTQAALAQFSPQLLSQLIDQQYSRLGGLVSVGQNAAAGVGNAGMATANGIGGALQQQGAALAGGALAQGRGQAGMWNAAGNAIGAYFGAGGKF